MSINGSLLQSIRLRLGRGIQPRFTTATHVADIYEAYIFSLVIRAAMNEGAVPEQDGTLTFRNPHDHHHRPTISAQSRSDLLRNPALYPCRD